MPHDPIGGYPGRERLGVMDALSAAETEGECDAVGEIRSGRRELVIGHPNRLEQTENEGKNASQGEDDGSMSNKARVDIASPRS